MTLRRGPVDVHAHWLPEELFGLPPGSPLPALHGRDGQLHLGELPLSIEVEAMSDAGRVLADTDSAGLGSRVLSAPPFAFPVVDAEGVDDYVGRFNEALAQVCRDSAGRLLGLGLVSLHDPDAARKQMDALSASGVIRGIAMPPLLSPPSLRSPLSSPPSLRSPLLSPPSLRSPLLGATSFDVSPMRDVLAVAAELDLAVLVHPMQLPRPEWPSYYLTNLIGNPVETATAAASLVLGGVLDEFPALRICLLHGGGCAPALVGRWQHGWDQRADVRSGGSRAPRQVFGRLWFDTLTHDSPALELLQAHAQPSHLLCGSDYPFDMGVTQPLDLPHSVGIDDGALEANARAFLGLDERD